MTEADWLSSADPQRMFAHLRGPLLARAATWLPWLGAARPLDDRKLRLLLCACTRMAVPYLPADAAAVTAAVVAAAERTADRDDRPHLAEVFLEALVKAGEQGFVLLHAARTAAGFDLTPGDEYDPRYGPVWWHLEPHRTVERQVLTVLAGETRNRPLADAVRCLFGNPFRRPEARPEWRTEAAVGVAAGVVAEWAWDRLPILADAVEEAGCGDPGVLAHLRGDGPHVPGCWAVDLVLGKG
jgi:hypothetical protein